MLIRDDIKKVLLDAKIFLVSARSMLAQVLNNNECPVRFEEAELRREFFRLAGFQPQKTGLGVEEN